MGKSAQKIISETNIFFEASGKSPFPRAMDGDLPPQSKMPVTCSKLMYFEVSKERPFPKAMDGDLSLTKQ